MALVLKTRKELGGKWLVLLCCRVNKVDVPPGPFVSIRSDSQAQIFAWRLHQIKVLSVILAGGSSVRSTSFTAANLRFAKRRG